MDWNDHPTLATPEKRRFQAVVNKMTNWERNQWARAGYPGLHKNDLKDLEPFAEAATRRLTGEWLVLA